MSGVNKVLLLGNLCADPEIRRTQGGKAIANLRLATGETWRDKATGERKERTEFHRVSIFSEPLCKIAEQYLRKGSKVYLEGQLQTRKWQDQSGSDRYSTEVVLQGFGGVLTMLDTPKEEPRQAEPQKPIGGPEYGMQAPAPRRVGGMSDHERPIGGMGGGGQRPPLDDDVPFMPDR